MAGMTEEFMELSEGNKTRTAFLVWCVMPSTT